MRAVFRIGVIALTAVTATSMLAPADASVVDVARWAPMCQGIDSPSATIGGSTGYSVRIDLDAPGIAFTTTPKSGPLDTTAQTTSQFLQSSGTQVAINAGFFDPCCNARPEAKNIEGLAISNGSLVSLDEAGRPVLLLTQSNQPTITSSAAGPLNLANAYNPVSGSTIILPNGQ